MRSIIFICSTLNTGGCEKVFVNLANLLIEKENVSVSFLLSHRCGELEKQLNKKIKIFSTDCRMLLSSKKITNFFKTNHYDYVISGPSYTNLVVIHSLSGMQVKIIGTQHNYKELDYLYPLSRFIFPCLCRKLYKKAYRIVSVSEGVKKYLLSYYNFDNIEVIYNPVNVECSDENIEEQKKILKNNGVDKYFISIGRLSPEKNLDMMIRAFYLFSRSHSEYKLMIVGSGQELLNLKEIVKQYGLDDKVCFVGNVNSPYFLLKKSQCLLQTSITEALPTVIIESLLLGKLVVTTPTKGALEILENGKLGLISRDFSVESFHMEMEKIFDYNIDEELMKARITDFSQTQSLKKYCELMEIY